MKKKFKKLYSLSSDKLDDNIDFDTFIFCWKNYDHYFTKKISKDCNLYENIELTKLYNKEKFIDRDEENLDWLFLQYA